MFVSFAGLPQDGHQRADLLPLEVDRLGGMWLRPTEAHTSLLVIFIKAG